jgi:choline dehydrogenase-like flavoprotein
LTDRELDVAVVGSGFAGLLVARELVRAGREVTVFERGGLLSHREQLEQSRQEVDEPTAAHNHEEDPSTPYRWDYAFAVGGGSTHWTGAAPRLLPSDFEMRTRFGVGLDWPVSYADLVPYYREAEELMGVAAGTNPLFGDERMGALAPHRLSPLDELLAEPLAPLVAMPQARATRELGGRAVCCGATVCRLCPVDARFSMLHLLDDTGLGRDPRLTIRDRTVVARLHTQDGRVERLETADSRGERGSVRAATVVLAAGGLENPGLLLRSGLGGGDVGRFLYDHGHRMVHLALDRPVPNGRGSALTTGMSYAWAEGEWRSGRGAQLVIPYNPGLELWSVLTREIASGASGGSLREEARARYGRTLLLDTVGEDLPRAERRVELSPSKDPFGLPLNRIVYPPDEGYVARGRRAMLDDLVERLRPMGARIVDTEYVGMGAHQLGTCRMGGVVDGDGRHLRLENLFVTGGSAFPSYSAAHPTLTICALAIRLGRLLAAAGS